MKYSNETLPGCENCCPFCGGSQIVIGDGKHLCNECKGSAPSYWWGSRPIENALADLVRKSANLPEYKDRFPILYCYKDAYGLCGACAAVVGLTREDGNIQLLVQDPYPCDHCKKLKEILPE